MIFAETFRQASNPLSTNFWLRPDNFFDKFLSENLKNEPHLDTLTRVLILEVADFRQ